MGSNDVLDIRLLGQPGINASGLPVKVPRRSTSMTLLALLILRRQQPVARSFLAFTLFPDFEEERALAELRRCLYLLTKALPPTAANEPWLAIDAETVRWNVRSAAFVDIIEYERYAREDAAFELAAELYAGDLLEDVYDDWVVVARERLRSTYLTILAELVERYRSARDYPRAINFANRLLVADPWREDVVRQLMGLRYASGDSSGALATCDRFAQRLRDEMGVSPMPETTLVREAIFLGRPLIGSVERAASAEGAGRAHALPFVGREDELALIHSRWDRAARGFGNGLFVSGEAGAGKTRLIGESVHAIEAEGGRVFAGGTSSPESSPYQCVAEALRGALTLLRADVANAFTVGVLARIFPELGGSSGVADIDTLSPEREATRLYEAFGAAVVALAGPRPLVLVFEDLHWASTATIDLIAAISRRIDRARVLLIATYRDEDVSAGHCLRRSIEALGREGRTTALHLGRLGRSDVERLVRADPALAHVDTEVVERLYAFSEGNALFLSEAIVDARERLAGTDRQVEHRAIDDIVASRLGRLSEHAQTVSEIAAVCGHGCSVDVVRDVAGLEMAQVLKGFDELLDRQLIREAGARDRYDFVFTHHLIRRSIYERIEGGVRRRRHARIAHVIETRSTTAPGSARELAGHYEAAAMRESATSWYVRAASEAATLYAHDDAVDFATRALDSTDDPERTIEAHFIREEANARLGNRAMQSRDLVALRDIARDTETRCRALRRWVLFLRGGDDREIERCAVAEFRELAARSAEPQWIGVAIAADAQFHLSIGAYADAKELALRALSHLPQAISSHERIEACSMLIEAQIALGELEDAERQLDAVHRLALAVGDRAAFCDALMRAVSAATLKQEFERAARSAKDALDLYRAMGDRIGEARALSSIAMACARLSRWSEARSANVAAAEIFEAVGERRGLARAQMNLAMVHARYGDFGVARAHLISARANHELLGDRRARTAALLNESFVAIWQGRPGEAKALALDAVAIATTMDHAAYRATAYANLGAAERDLGELDAAIAHMERGLKIQLALNRLADAVSDLADLALAYARRGDAATARGYAERILTIDRSWTESAIFPPYPLWIVACVLHWNGDARASDTFARAWQLAVRIVESIVEPELRERFMALPFYVEMQRIDGERGWPPGPRVARGTSRVRRRTKLKR